MLFDNYIGRKRDVVGGILAGLLTVGFVAAKAVAGLALGSEEISDGHVSKFIALCKELMGTSRDGPVVWFCGADVFGTRQEVPRP